jgi:RNAse (barnase) inhibitor barstar
MNMDTNEDSNTATNKDDFTHNLRNNADFYVPLSRLSTISKFSQYNLPSLWYSLDCNLHEIPAKIMFSIKLKANKIAALRDHPECNRLL